MCKGTCLLEPFKSTTGLMIFMSKLWLKFNILSSGLAKAFFTNHLLIDIELVNTFSSKSVVLYILEGLV